MHLVQIDWLYKYRRQFQNTFGCYSPRASCSATTREPVHAPPAGLKTHMSLQGVQQWLRGVCMQDKLARSQAKSWQKKLAKSDQKCHANMRRPAFCWGEMQGMARDAAGWACIRYIAAQKCCMCAHRDARYTKTDVAWYRESFCSPPL